MSQFLKFVLFGLVIFAVYKYATGEKGTELKYEILIDEGVTLTNRARLKVRNYYKMSKSLPESASDVGAGRAESYTGESLIRMDIKDGGIVVLTYDAKSGVEGGEITYSPNIQDEYFVGWNCETYDYPEISKILPNCKYKEYK